MSRLGGDEFVILIEDSSGALDEAETVSRRVLQSWTTPFVLDSQQIVLSASLGIAIGDVSFTASSMLRNADVAMYRAKTTGKATRAVYEPAMRMQLKSLRNHQCDFGQGFLLGRPLEMSDAAALLAELEPAKPAHADSR